MASPNIIDERFLSFICLYIVFGYHCFCLRQNSLSHHPNPTSFRLQTARLRFPPPPPPLFFFPPFVSTPLSLYLQDRRLAGLCCIYPSSLWSAVDRSLAKWGINWLHNGYYLCLMMMDMTSDGGRGKSIYGYGFLHVSFIRKS